MVEQVHSIGYTARSYADAPEIDGVVYIETDQTLIPGEYRQVRITDSDEYDCYAKLLPT
jgi:ribosomal protein S12 methylthiotransferase